LGEKNITIVIVIGVGEGFGGKENNFIKEYFK